MTLKSLAEEIYALPYRQRIARLKEIQPPDLGMIKAYMDQMRKRDQDANRKRNLQAINRVPFVNGKCKP